MNKQQLKEALDQAEDQCVSLLLQRDDARAEVEQLRAAMATAKVAHGQLILIREVERLRAALASAVATYAPCHGEGCEGHTHPWEEA